MMDPDSVLVGCLLGVLLSIGSFWILFVWQRSAPDAPTRSAVDDDTEKRLSVWRARRAETVKTFGRSP